MQCAMGLGSSGWANSSTGRTHYLLGGISEHFMKQEYTLGGMAVSHRAPCAQIGKILSRQITYQHAFGMWEETGEPRGNLHVHGS